MCHLPRPGSFVLAALILSVPLHARFSEAPLGPVPATVNMVLSPNKRHVAYPVPEAGKKRVFIDGQAAGPQFEGLFLAKTFVTSRDGLHRAYSVVKEIKNESCQSCEPVGEWRAVIDGRAGPVFDNISGLTLSSDGQRFAYGAITRADGQDIWTLMVDDEMTPLPYAALTYASPAFTPDGRRLVYVAKKGERAVVVIDGQEGPIYDKIGQPIPIFSPDGAHIAYTARDYGQPESVILDGKAGPGFDNIPPQSLLFSPAGGRLAYGGQHINGNWSAVVDGVVGPTYDQVDRLAFSPDGRHFAYHAKKGERSILVLDGHETVTCEAIAADSPAFSPDGRRLAQGLQRDGCWRMFTVDCESREAEPLGPDFTHGAGRPLFSRDGGRVAFIGWSGDKRVAVVGGEAGPPFDAITNLTFSPDGRRIAYEAGRFYKDDPTKSDTWFPVVDHKPRPEYDAFLRGSGTFSEDGRHFAYSASQGDRRVVVIDDQISSGYRAICSVLPGAAGGFEALVVGEQLFRLNWKPL